MISLATPTIVSKRFCAHASSALRRPCVPTARSFGGTAHLALPMKAGTVLKFLDFVKDKDPPVVLQREEYPSWVGDLATPQVNLATLRRIPNEEADDPDIRRYLKLTRRLRIRDRNAQASV